MRWIQRKQAPQKSKMDQPAVTGIPIQRMLPGQKRGALPAYDVRVRYQPTPASQIHTGGGVIQCEGLGSLFCCGCDDVTDTEQQQQQPPPPPRPQVLGCRNDGACAVHALFWLKWEPGYTKEEGLEMNRIQNAQFGALGTQVNTDNLTAFLSMTESVMVLFFRTGESIAFHVMYMDGTGYLYGACNECVKSMLNTACFPGKDPIEVKFVIQDRMFNLDGRTIIKYVTQAEYTAFYNL